MPHFNPPVGVAAKLCLSPAQPAFCVSYLATRKDPLGDREGVLDLICRLTFFEAVAIDRHHLIPLIDTVLINCFQLRLAFCYLCLSKSVGAGIVKLTHQASPPLSNELANIEFLPDSFTRIET